jgi:subtilase family serine protease
MAFATVGPAAPESHARGAGRPDVASAGVTGTPQLRYPGVRGASGPAGGYTPAQIQAAYFLRPLFRAGIDGRRQSIVIVDSFGSPTIRHDLGVFDRTFKLAAPPSLLIIHPAGRIPAYNPNNSQMVSWAEETTLDVEWAHVMAPDARIVLTETPVSENEGISGFPQIVTAEKYVLKHRLGGVISQSLAATEPTFPSGRALRALRGAYVEAAMPSHNVTVLAASGDDGASGQQSNESLLYTRPVTEWPASDPLVTGVGGLDLRLDSLGRRTAPDRVWNDGGTSAGGGGKSIFFSRPSFQNGVSGVVGRQRGVPDISMSASCDHPVDVYQSFRGQPAGWFDICGTSEATPLFAGIVALADQVAGHPIGPINGYLYRLAARQAPGIIDVRQGNNTVEFFQGNKQHTVRGFTAVRGYDLSSGVGTIDAALFVRELAALAMSHG